jgi:hypothetical protein
MTTIPEKEASYWAKITSAIEKWVIDHDDVAFRKRAARSGLADDQIDTAIRVMRNQLQ